MFVISIFSFDLVRGIQDAEVLVHHLAGSGIICGLYYGKIPLVVQENKPVLAH